MHTLSHPNVMSLTGVCLDSSGGPAVVMPYMDKGSVLQYLKKERGKLVPPIDADCSVVCTFLINEKVKLVCLGKFMREIPVNLLKHHPPINKLVIVMALSRQPLAQIGKSFPTRHGRRAR